MSELRCPKCSIMTVRHERSQCASIRCSACRGVWLEWTKIEWQLADPASLWNVLSKDGAITDRIYSVCRCRCRSLCPARYGGIKIGWCPTCKDVFFDAGELAGMRAIMRQTPPASTPALSATLGTDENADTVVGSVLVEVVVHALCSVFVSLGDSLYVRRLTSALLSIICGSSACAGGGSRSNPPPRVGPLIPQRSITNTSTASLSTSTTEVARRLTPRELFSGPPALPTVESWKGVERRALRVQGYPRGASTCKPASTPNVPAG